jgi:hypothetical protein
VKLFRFLVSLYSLIGTCNSVQNCAFRDCTGIFVASCDCMEVVKLFRFLLSPFINAFTGEFKNFTSVEFQSLRVYSS